MAKKLYVKLQTPTVEMPITTMDAAGTETTMFVGFKRYDLTEIVERIAQWELLESIEDLVKAEIIYIREVAVEIHDDTSDKITPYIIKDTRTEKKIDGLWDTSEECYTIVIDKLFNSPPCKTAIINTFNSIFLNAAVTTREAELGN